MKRFLSGLSTFFVTLAIVSLGLSLWAARQVAPSNTNNETKKIGVSAAYDPAALSTAAIARVKLVPNQPWNHPTPQSALRGDRERVEVLARSITFPGVLSQGKLVLSAEFPNAVSLCLVATNYSGRVQGLIWAMDRDTVEKHKLYWIIDLAGEVFDECLEAFLHSTLPGENGNAHNQIQDVKDQLASPVELIQAGLRFAKTVGVEPGGVAIGVSFPTAGRN